MKTLLLIEGNHQLGPSLSEFLRQSGWDVLAAQNMETGHELARQRRPDAVLCDLEVSSTDGVQVCTALRRNQALQDTRILAVFSPENNSAAGHALLEAGADAILLKPVNPGDVLDFLNGSWRQGASDFPGRIPEGPAGPWLRFWGVRGSIPTPGPSTVYFGGNTSCIEVRADEEIIILDCGTGVRPLGLELMREFKAQPLKLTILISHTHWDHIQGFPFFPPAYEPRNHIRILGYKGAKAGLKGVFSQQMETPYFPIGLKAMPGSIAIEEIRDLNFSIGKIHVQATFMNHPGHCVGYRLQTSAGSIVYMTDNEPFYRSRMQSGRISFPRPEAAAFVHAEEGQMARFLQNADVLISDAQYDSEEYRSHLGWGHGCLDDVVSLALNGNVRRLFLFHHDPSHDDEKIRQMVDRARDLVRARQSPMQVEAAREGQRVHLLTAAAHPPLQSAGSPS